MNRETRDKFASGTKQDDLTTGNACWETPPLVFAKLNADFGPFDVDLTADAGRRLCSTWFGPGSNVGEFDALTANWLAHGNNGYSNPPYGPFVQKLLMRARLLAGSRGFTSTLLLPMRVTKAFKSEVLKHGKDVGASDLLFCDSRITFFEDGLPRLNKEQWRKFGKAVPDPAMFDSIIVRYTPGAQTFNVDTWKVPPHVTAEDLKRASLRMAA